MVPLWLAESVTNYEHYKFYFFSIMLEGKYIFGCGKSMSDFFKHKYLLTFQLFHMGLKAGVSVYI